MLSFAIIVAYFVSVIRTIFSMFFIFLSTFIVLLPFGINLFTRYEEIEILYLFLFLSTAIPFIYSILDFIFGFTVKKQNTEIISFNAIKLPSMLWILQLMWKISEIANISNIDLYIEKSEKLRVYSMGSARKKRIFISLGFITYVSAKTLDNIERNRIIASALSCETSHLMNYDFLPNMILEGNSSVTKILSIIATIPIRILFIPFLLLPIIRNLTVYIMDFVVKCLEFIDRCVYSVIRHIYSNIKYRLFEKHIESRTDYQASQIVNKESVIMMLAILKNTPYNDNYYDHGLALDRIMALTKKDIADNIQNEDHLISCMISICICFIVSSLFGIGAEAWLLPVFIMENSTILHQLFIGIFNKIVFIKDLIIDGYKTLSF